MTNTTNTKQTKEQIEAAVAVACSELVAILPEHKGGLHIEHNPGACCYRNVKEELELRHDLYTWESDEAKARAISTNSMWTIQWYPKTPIGFHVVAAPTLYEAVRLCIKTGAMI